MQRQHAPDTARDKYSTVMVVFLFCMVAKVCGGELCGRSKRCIECSFFRRFSLFALCIFDALLNQRVSHRSRAIIRRACAYNT